MNNEEKILALLEAQGKQLGALTDKVAQLDTLMDKVDTLTGRVDSLTDKVAELDTRSQRTAVLLETEIDRKLTLLYEGHDAIMETLDSLASKSRVEILEDDVQLLKDAIRLMRQEITELKKAQ